MTAKGSMTGKAVTHGTIGTVSQTREPIPPTTPSGAPASVTFPSDLSRLMAATTRKQWLTAAFPGMDQCGFGTHSGLLCPFY
jgi:hypothetical protein